MYIRASLCACALGCWCPLWPEVLHALGVTGGYELPDTGTGNLIPVFWEIRKCS